jgi:hypothetical protein
LPETNSNAKREFSFNQTHSVSEIKSHWQSYKNSIRITPGFDIPSLNQRSYGIQFHRPVNKDEVFVWLEPIKDNQGSDWSVRLEPKAAGNYRVYLGEVVLFGNKETFKVVTCWRV